MSFFRNQVSLTWDVCTFYKNIELGIPYTKEWLSIQDLGNQYVK